MQIKNIAKFLPTALALTLVATTTAATEVAEITEITEVATTVTTIPEERFADVAPADWHYGYISDMANRGFVSGTGSGIFAPEAKLSVSAFATMISNGFYGRSYLHADDVVWWLPYMDTCAARDGLKGTIAENPEDWESVVNQELTRYEMAMIIYNLLLDRELEVISTEKEAEVLGGLTDEINAHYRTAVATVYDYGFISGRSDGSFDGDATLSRAEAAVVLSVLVNSPSVSVERLQILG